jgi:hypothetical protein
MNMNGTNSILYFRSGSTIVAPCFPIILPNGWVRLKVEAEVDVVEVEVEVNRARKIEFVLRSGYCSMALFKTRVVLYSSMGLPA